MFVTEPPLCLQNCYEAPAFFLTMVVVAFIAGAMIKSWLHVFPAAVVVVVAGHLTGALAWSAFGSHVFPWQENPLGHAQFWFDRFITFVLILLEVLLVFLVLSLARFVGGGAVGRVLGYIATIAAIAFGGPAIFDYFSAPVVEPTPQLARVAGIVRRLDAANDSRCFVNPAGRVDIPNAAAPVHAKASPRTYETAPLLQSGTGIHRGNGPLLTPIEGYRTPNFGSYPKDNYFVALRVVVGTDGYVLAAEPIDGPPDAFPSAAEIAKQLRFVPFLRDGEPTIVRLQHVFVPTGPPARKPTRLVPFPSVGDKTAVRIHLVQAFVQDYGPGYAVTIRGDGAVRFEGLERVALSGEHCASIAPEAVDELIAAFRAADFFSLDDVYRSKVDPEPAVAVSITIGGKSKTVIDYGGFAAGMPDAVFRLQTLIDYTAAVRRWTRGDAQTGPSLVAERWDFGRSDDANRLMLPGAAQIGDVAAVRDLIRLGASVARGHQAPLRPAASRGDFEMVRALLASPTRWTKEELTDALAAIVGFGTNQLVRALLQRGADPNARGFARHSVLALAAQAGVPAPVASLAQAGADINATDQLGRTALHETELRNPEIKIESALADRGAVAEVLLRAGIPVDVRDDWQRTPLIDNRRGHEGVAAALIAYGADVNAQDSDGSTPLMTNDNPKTTEMLLAAGANPFLLDAQGRTVFDGRDDVGTLETGSAILKVIDRWLAAHPKEAQRAREEAARIGKTHIPKRREPSEPSFDDMIPTTEVGGPPYELLELGLFVIVQMFVAFGLTMMGRRLLENQV